MKTKEQLKELSNDALIQELIGATWDVCRAPLGNALLAANQYLPIVRDAVKERMK